MCWMGRRWSFSIITIPQKFFTMLGFDIEAECTVRGNELVIRPVRTNTGGEFAEQILADLIARGYSGNELLERFKKVQGQVRPAVEAMLADAERAASSQSGHISYEDVLVRRMRNDCCDYGRNQREFL